MLNRLEGGNGCAKLFSFLRVFSCRVQRALRNAQRLLRLINQLLDLAKQLDRLFACLVAER